MKYVLYLYLLGIVLTLLSIFVRLMESLVTLLESPLPGIFRITRGPLVNRAHPERFSRSSM
ncbi:hypoxia-inducible lipid droplet-associated protein-like [Meriones unguiculatus]|uniref:hypoxia-inducible lipid droplet-associated protein-like n=1 Tax=Meriones unguiculatus TaxID=10047 RepID=UPI00293E12A4|nr:hypoxia-inducible lipid droplet-associated protein-like [Meriones unguiculatus]